MKPNGTFRQDIICVATRRIDDDLPTNVQHLMLHLASNHEILYVEPPVDSVFLSRNPEFHLRAQKLKNTCPPSLHPVYPEVFPYEKLFPFFLNWINRYNTIRFIKQAAKHIEICPDILWLFRPQDYWIASHFKTSCLCYHVTDKYNTMPLNAKSAADALKLERIEDKVIDRANIVFCTARSLWKDVSQKSEHAVYVGNVADVKHFSKANEFSTRVPEDIANLPRPVIGFFGAISDYKIDYDLIHDTSQEFPDASIVLIGPVRDNALPDNDKSSQNNNIHYFGARNYLTLPGYLKGFDICIIPFKDSQYTRHVFPLKFFEYLAAGKPVVSTPLPSLGDFRNLFYSARNSAEWINAIRFAINENDRHLEEKRKKAAIQNSWENRIRQIEGYLLKLKC